MLGAVRRRWAPVLATAAPRLAAQLEFAPFFLRAEFAPFLVRAAARPSLARFQSSSPASSTPSSPAAAAGAAPPPAPAPTPSLFERGAGLVREYGPVGLGLYFTLWAVPFGSSFLVFSTCDNFGQDPGSWVTYFAGEEMRVRLWTTLGMEPAARLSPQMVSVVLAYLVCEVIETPRIAATVFLTPRVKRWLYPDLVAASPSSATTAAEAPAEGSGSAGAAPR